MITISVCMIVKNEEKNLSRCLECVKDFADEIIIVDTGSTDKTKDIAKKYTDKIYDYEWSNNFSKARNFSFSKATKDYIYIADADEIIDKENKKKILDLKKVLLEEIEIVQMKYTNQLEFGSTYNYDTEYRAKLVKRKRNFEWIDQIHETLRIQPIIYDSDIEIIHKPHESHAKRDLAIFQKLIKNGEKLSSKLIHLYARELYISGDDDDFIDALDFYKNVLEDDNTDNEKWRYAACVLIKAYRIKKDYEQMLCIGIKAIANKPDAEVCFELGEYHFDKENYKEACIWFYNAAYECEPLLNIHCGGDFALHRLAECYKLLGNEEQSNLYEQLEEKWILDYNSMDANKKLSRNI